MSDGQPVARQFFRLLEESQFWPIDRLLDYQYTELSQLLAFARAEVPFYRDRLQVLYRRDGSIDWSRWPEVPVLTRAELAAHRPQLLAPHPPAGHGATRDFTTSGSTGIAIATRHTQLAAEAWTAAGWRAQRWWGCDWSAALAHWHYFERDRDAGDPDRAQGAWGNPDFPSARGGRQFTIDRGLPAQRLIDHLRRHHVKYLTVPALNAFAIALEARAQLLSAPLEAIFNFSMAAEAEHREACAAVFGARIRSLYSSKEGGFIAHSCGEGEHYHVNAEYVLVEILDGEGRACRPGEVGRVVVTPFLATAQPLIRYEQGDLARQGDAPGTCRCGVHLPMIAAVEGRTYHLFRLPGGRRVVPTIPDSLRPGLGATTWQFAQTSPREIECRYVAAANAGAPAMAAIAAEIQAKLDPGFAVTFRRLDAVPLTTAGKYLKYVCELRD
jgi:phenylacetate-CoA ligase